MSNGLGARGSYSRFNGESCIVTIENLFCNPRYHYERGFREFIVVQEMRYTIVLRLESKWVCAIFKSKITGQPYMDYESHETI
ncbi:hypothetical protein ACS0TY_012746 [Phlomoides rotata]